MPRVVISGITGHLGRELSTQLSAAGFDVHGLTRQPIRSIEPWMPPTRLHHVDGRTETLIAVFDKVRPHTVFHLAALCQADHASADVAAFVEANILYGAQVLEAMRASGCRRIIAAGSYLQHADTGEYRALNLYAATKQAFESLLEYYATAYEFASVRLTLPNIYSEHETRPRLMTDIAAACRGRFALHLRDPQARVDLVHVEDVAQAFVRTTGLLGTHAAPTGRLSRYSVTSGADVSSMELVEMFERLGGRKLTVKTREQSQPSRRTRPWRGAVLPGWMPHVDLEDGIARILAARSTSREANLTPLVAS